MRRRIVIQSCVWKSIISSCVAGAFGAGSYAAGRGQAFLQAKFIMKKQIIRISILQSSKIATALYFLMGFIYSLIGIPLLIFGNTALRIEGVIFLFMPIIMGAFGFIFFVIFAALYNLLASWLGGFEVEVKNTE
jgi:hypothetical protein